MTFKEAYGLLEEKVKSITTEEEWRNFLRFKKKFHKYSMLNQLLIYITRPTATYVAGFRVWQKEFKRYVKRGEHGIPILAPIIVKKKKENEEDDTAYLTGYKAVYVFDIEQTEGEAMPKELYFGMPDNSENSVGSNLLLSKLLSNACKIVDIKFHNFQLSAVGFYSTKDNSIVIKPSLDFTSKCSTLLHEFAHYIHETRYKDQIKDFTTEQREFIAESSAFIVGDRVNLDMLTKSAQYIKSWTGDCNMFHTMSIVIEKVSNEMLEIFKLNKSKEKPSVHSQNENTPVDPFLENELGITA